MGAKNPYSVSAKALERFTKKATTAVTFCRAVGFLGEQISTLGAAAQGIAYENAAIGEDFGITTHGTEVGESGAAIATVGLPLTVDATGRFIPAATTGHFIFGRAMGTAAGAGEYIEVEITKEGKV